MTVWPTAVGPSALLILALEERAKGGRAELKRGGMDALAVELLMPRSMARGMLAASLLNPSLLKPPSSPGEG